MQPPTESSCHRTRRFSTDDASKTQMIAMKTFAVLLTLAGDACAAAGAPAINLKQLMIGVSCLVSTEGAPGGSTFAGAGALCSLSSNCGNDDILTNKNLAATAVSTACDTSSAGAAAGTHNIMRAVPRPSGGYGSARHMIQTDILDATNLTGAAVAAASCTLSPDDTHVLPPGGGDLLWGSGGKKNLGIPASAGTQGRARAPIPSPGISSR